MSSDLESRGARSEAPHRAPGRPRAAESVDERAFLDAALRAFAVHGYAGVSVRTLSKELGVSHGWVHQRFGSKSNLWYAAIDAAFGTQAAVLQFDPTVTDPVQQLELSLRAFLHYSARHPELLALMNIEGAQDTERLDHIYDRYIAPGLAPIDRLRRHLIDEGRIRPVSMRTLFLLLGHGGVAPFALVPLARRLDPSDPTTDDAIDEHVEAIVRIVMDGLRTGD